MTRLLLVAAALVVVLAMAGVGAGAEWDVYPGAGTPIQMAIDGAGEGDTIYVHAGTYVENVDVDKRITLIGDGVDVVTVRAADASDNVFEVRDDWINVSGFTVTGATYGYGICLHRDHCNISDNSASNNSRGIVLSYSNNNTLQSNIANSNNVCGIWLWSSNNNTLSDNTASNNNRGIVLESSNNNTLTDNNASNNSQGIRLWGLSNSNILYHNNLIDNTQNAYDDPGTNQWDSGSEGNYYGDDYTGTDSDGDGIGDDPYPIPGGDSVDNYPLMNPWGSTSSTGPVHNINKGTNYTTIRAAIDDASTGDEIHVDAGTYVENVIVDKQLTLIGEGADMVIVQAADSQDHVIEVAADWVNISGFTVTGTKYSWKAGIYLNHSNYSHISDNNASNNDCGILIGHSFNNNLQRNIYFDNWVGMSLQSSSYNILKSNNASRSDYFGIHLEHSPSNTIINNLAFSNVYGGISVGESSSENNLTGNTANLNDGDGIYIWRSNNCILMNNNAISNGKIGIVLEDANISTIANNIVENNYGGIYLNDSINNLIYYNNIEYNTNQANDHTAANSWDSGYPSGGNYWSDYIGNDNNKGLNQDQIVSPPNQRVRRMRASIYLNPVS